jgi:6-phosphogluconolactonase (cycloisomerase 2 family)
MLVAAGLLLVPAAAPAHLEAPEPATAVPGLTAAQGLALAPDGRHLYVAFQGSPGHVGVFQRNAFTGRIGFVEQQTDGVGSVDGVGAATATAVSPDGRHVYAAGPGDDAIAIFARDPGDGRLGWLGEVRDGVGGVDGLDGVSVLALSPDGSHLYAVGAFDEGIAVFARNAATGALASVEGERAGTLVLDRALAVSPDGRHVYGASFFGDAIAIFARNPGTGALTHLADVVDGVGGVDGLAGASALALSRDGRFLYAAGFDDDALAVFSRDPASGGLVLVEVERSGVGTVPSFVLDGPAWVALSPDGRRLYLSSTNDDFVTSFVRDPISGTVAYDSQIDDAGPLAVSPDGRHVYTTPSLRDVAQPLAESVLAPGAVLRDGVDGITGLDQSYGVAVAPGGRHVYVTGASDGALNAFVLDPGTHSLTLIETERDGVDGVDGLGLATRVAVSPDGRHVYASAGEAAVAAFSRDLATGALAFVEAEKDGVAGVDGLAGANGITVSPDGEHVYVAGFLDDAVAVFARDAATGALDFVEAHRVPGTGSLAGAIDVAVSPDGSAVYAVGFDAGSLVALARDPITGALAEIDAEFDGAGGVTGLARPNGVAVAPDGGEVLVATGGGTLTRFARSGAGTLAFVESRVLFGIAGRIALANGGRLVLVPISNAAGFNGVMVLGRDPSTGELGWLPSAPDGALGFDGMQGATDVAVSPTGHTFVTGSAEDALALLVPEPDASVLGAIAAFTCAVLRRRA